MADPITWAAVGFQALGAIQSANTQAANQRAIAQASDYNAQVARNSAEAAMIASTSQQTAQNRQARQLAGRQRAAAAESGLGMGGSNRDVIDQSGTLAELDQLNLAYEGTLKANGFMAQSELDSFNAQMARRNASAARTQGFLQAGAAIGQGLMSYNRANTPAPPTKSVVGEMGGGSGLRLGNWGGMSSFGGRFG